MTIKHTRVQALSFAVAATAMVTASLPVFASDADTRIESEFEQTYVYRTYLKDDAIKADAKNGIVTLRGTVGEESHKALAEETVAGLRGVSRVDNRLATTAEVAAVSADLWTGRKVKLALLFHRFVNAGNTTVSVKDGVVTLSGEATSVAQKELTTEYAKDIAGVKEVRNEMSVALVAPPPERTTREKIDDASVTAQVRTALVTHRSTSTVRAKIETRDGVVQLTGIAQNDAERSLVTKLVSDIHGVTSVKNDMTVREQKSK